MSAPRRILKGSSYLVTRRTSERRFFFKPTPLTVLICAYCLAVAARKHGIILHAWLFMSNHYHLVLTDPAGQLPCFLEQLNRLLAKALNAQWGRGENLFSTEQTSIELLGGREDIFNAIVYTLLNPVKAGLVERVEEWPGASSFSTLAGPQTPTDHARPSVYFSAQRSSMPTVASLEAVAPPDSSFPTETESSWNERLRAAVAKGERIYAAERKAKGRRVLGVARILAQRETDRPPPEPRTTAKAKAGAKAALVAKRRPLVTCENAKRRRELLFQLAEFRVRHREARLAFADGDREVTFPAGTYRMRLIGARCEELACVA